MPFFVEIGPAISEMFEGLLPYMGMAAILSCDLDYLYIYVSAPLHIDVSSKIWRWLAKRFRVSKKLFEIVNARTDTGLSTIL